MIFLNKFELLLDYYRIVIASLKLYVNACDIYISILLHTFSRHVTQNIIRLSTLSREGVQNKQIDVERREIRKSDTGTVRYSKELKSSLQLPFLSFT